MRRVVAMADVAVAVDSPAGWSAAVELLFGGCRPASASASARIELAITGAAPERPRRRPDVSYPDHVDLWFEPEALVVFDRLGVGAVSRAGRIASGGEGDDRSWRLVVQYALVHALGLLGRHALHAAAVARDGRALLAVGEAGAGKSTLAYAAWTHGWQVLTDDLAWLWLDDASPTGVRLAGFPKPLAVPGELLGDAPNGAAAMAGDPRRRWLLPFDAVSAGDPLPLVGVLELGHGLSRAALHPVASGAPLLPTILRYNPLVESAAVVRRLFPVAAAVSRLPALRLEHDPDPTVRADRTAALLDEALHRFVGGFVAPPQ